MNERKLIKGVPIKEIVERYREYGNVWKVGEHFGISGQTIHSTLKEIGVVKPINVFSEEDKAVLIAEYEYYRDREELKILAEKLGRTVPFICRKAKALGRTGRPEHFVISKKGHEKKSEIAKRRIKEYGHPRGMLGKKHSDEAKKRFAEIGRERWIQNADKYRTPEKRRMRSDMMSDLQRRGKIAPRSRCYMFNASVGGKDFLAKSTWEYDIALYLEYLKKGGLITDWLYEPASFQFKYNTLGVRTYKPDFSVIKGDRVYYIEVKGWRDRHYEIKKDLMLSEYPGVRIFYICEKEYKAIYKKHRNDISDFGTIKEKLREDRGGEVYRQG